MSSSDNSNKLLEHYKNICYDVRYDGCEIRFIGKNGNDICKKPFEVYSCSKEVLNVIDGKGYYELPGKKFLIFNPKNKIHSIQTETSYRWYAITSSLKEFSFEMNREWYPCFCNNLPLVYSEKNNLIIVPDFNTTNIIRDEKNTLMIFPLLESILNIYPYYTGYNLQQIRTSLIGFFEISHSDIMDTMEYLFNYFKDDFNKVSSEEGCSFSDIHKCIFNIKLKHHYNELAEKIPTSNKVAKIMSKVCMIVKSLTITNFPNGDVSWYINKCEEREKIGSIIIYRNGPYAFIENSKFTLNSKYHVYYEDIIILPEISVDGVTHPHGSTIGLRNKNDQCIEFRGSLFFDLSSKERMVLHLMYFEFINGSLTSDTNFECAIKEYPFSEKDIKYRQVFINKIKNILLSNVMNIKNEI